MFLIFFISFYVFIRNLPKLTYTKCVLVKKFSETETYVNFRLVLTETEMKRADETDKTSKKNNMLCKAKMHPI